MNKYATIIIISGGTFLAIAFRFAFDNLLFDFFINHLKAYGFPEAKIVANAAPFLIAGATLWVIWSFLRLKIENKYNFPQIPDQDISEAIDYIVNDSNIKLKQNLAPYIEEYGPAKGQMVTPRGAEHQDTLIKLCERVINGHIKIWGLKQLFSGSPVFENTLREIPIEFWKENTLSPLMCYCITIAYPQTVCVTMQQNGIQYTGLKVNKIEIEKCFPKKSLFTLFWKKVRRTPRTTYRD